MYVYMPSEDGGVKQDTTDLECSATTHTRVIGS